MRQPYDENFPKIARFRTAAVRSPYEISHPHGSRNVARRFFDMFIFLANAVRNMMVARLPYGSRKSAARQPHEITFQISPKILAIDLRRSYGSRANVLRFKWKTATKRAKPVQTVRPSHGSRTICWTCLTLFLFWEVFKYLQRSLLEIGLLNTSFMKEVYCKYSAIHYSRQYKYCF